MKRRPLIRTAALLMLAIGIVLLLSGQAPALANDDSSWLLGQLNAVRAQHGLPTMRLDGRLTASATAHSQYLASSTWTNPHIEANGSTPRSRMIAAGYIGSYYSENVYGGGLATVQIAFNWWLNSPIHYAGIVSPNVTDIGIGIASGPYGQFFTTDFAAGGSGSSAESASAVPAAVPAAVNNQAAPPPVVIPTRRPRPTLTATASLTPSSTFTPWPTVTVTPSSTAPPPTPTAIELAVSPLAATVSITETSSPMPSPSAAAVAIISTVAAATDTPPGSVPVATVPATNGAGLIRTLIPVLIGVQVLIFGGLLFRRRATGG